jgi:hypothetical protein
MVTLIRVEVVVCKMVRKGSNGTLKYEELFEGGRLTLYKERLFGIGRFYLFSCYLFSWIVKQQMTLKQHWIQVMFWHLNPNFK